MRVVIFGSRGITDMAILEQAIKQASFHITTIISGGAKGADALGEAYANAHNIPLEIYKPDWKKYGRKAGPLRNEQMAKLADAGIGLWDGQSRGTRHMHSYMQKIGKPVYCKIFDV